MIGLSGPSGPVSEKHPQSPSDASELHNRWHLRTALQSSLGKRLRKTPAIIVDVSIAIHSGLWRNDQLLHQSWSFSLCFPGGHPCFLMWFYFKPQVQPQSMKYYSFASFTRKINVNKKDRSGIYGFLGRSFSAFSIPTVGGNATCTVVPNPSM